MIVAASFAVLSASALQGCREIVGVPGASSLSDIERPPPLCECGELYDQGEVVREACREAYGVLPDLGPGDESLPFGSKEELLASEACGACRANDPGAASTCWVDLLESAGRSGADGASCEGPGDCDSWACCADDELAGGSCCAGCVGCAEFLGGSGGTMCADSVPVYASLVDCVCGELSGVVPGECVAQCGVECTSPSRDCVDCLLGSVGQACTAAEQACLGAGSRPKPRSTQ